MCLQLMPKSWECKRRHTSYPKAAISDWQTGLCPLNVGKVAVVGDVLDCLSQECVKLRQRSV